MSPATETESHSAFVSRTIPDTQVGAQLGWFLGAVADLPMSQQVIHSHFDSFFLSEVSPDQLNAVLRGVPAAGGASLVGLLSEAPTSLVAVATFGAETVRVTISVDNSGLIDGLLLEPYLPPSPSSWAAVDHTLSTLAPDVSFLAAEVPTDGNCKPLHQVNSSAARPLGSEFKLFVLGALAREIGAGRLSWARDLTVQDDLRSVGNALGSGSLQYSPTGTRVSVEEVAAKMISISDNTAADMLIHLVGRSAVETQFREWSTHAAANVPFLTTRELFMLHYVDYPTLANEYLGLSPTKRGAFLATSVDPLPLNEIQGSTQPRDVERIEWFASPDDMCRAFAGLQRLSDQQGLKPIRSILSINPGGIGLDHSKWPTVWFKGGSEPGVLTLGYLAKNAKGRSFVVSAMISNPAATLPTDATMQLLAVARGAFGLVG
jgi:hypothetical protein